MANKENIKVWVDALRSGEYKQTTGTLHRNGLNPYANHASIGYCCLGVACEVSEIVKDRRNFSYGIEQFDGETTKLPRSVMKWLGLQKQVPSVKTPHGWELLDELNDEGKDFSEIADYIEETYL